MWYNSIVYAIHYLGEIFCHCLCGIGSSHGSMQAIDFPHFGLVRCAGVGGCCWSGVREKYYWLAGGWKLVLERCEENTIGLEAAGAAEQND